MQRNRPIRTTNVSTVHSKTSSAKYHRSTNQTIVSDLTAPVTLFPESVSPNVATAPSASNKNTSSVQDTKHPPTPVVSPSPTTVQSISKPKSVSFKVGTKVIVTNSYLGKKGVVGVVKKVTPAYYLIQPVEGGKPFPRHHNNVKLFK